MGSAHCEHTPNFFMHVRVLSILALVKAMTNPVIETIRNRRTIRAYEPEPKKRQKFYLVCKVARFLNRITAVDAVISKGSVKKNGWNSGTATSLST